MGRLVASASMVAILFVGLGTSARAAETESPAHQASGLVASSGPEARVRQVLASGEMYAVAGGSLLVSEDVSKRLSDQGLSSESIETTTSLASPPWAACGVYDSNTKVVYQYSRAQISGVSGTRATLACGSSVWGFRHIKSAHMSQWATKGSYIGATWGQMAHWAMVQTLSRPCSKYRQTSNDTLQYVTPVQIKDDDGRVVHTFGSRVVVARVTQNIITAYPQTATC